MGTDAKACMFDLTGRVAMVTGGCQNFGKEIATGLAEVGADLVVTSRDAAKAERAAAEYAEQFGVKVLGAEMELTSEESVAAAFKAAVDEYGRLDVLVNNAGGHLGGTTGGLLDEPLEAWEGFIRINLTGTFLTIREAARIMVPAGRGSIINISSISSLLGRDRSVYPEGMTPNPVPYTAAKAGVIGLTYDAAAILGEHGIRVNSVAPGGFERGQDPTFVKAYSERVMLGRMGVDGQDLKGVVVFLASDAASYVTGHNLYVDGGFSRFK